MKLWPKLRPKGRGTGRRADFRADRRAAGDALEDWMAARTGVEVSVEPKTAVSPVTMVLVAHDGEFTRRKVTDPESAKTFARQHRLPSTTRPSSGTRSGCATIPAGRPSWSGAPTGRSPTAPEPAPRRRRQARIKVAGTDQRCPFGAGGAGAPGFVHAPPATPAGAAAPPRAGADCLRRDRQLPGDGSRAAGRGQARSASTASRVRTGTPVAPEEVYP